GAREPLAGGGVEDDGAAARGGANPSQAQQASALVDGFQAAFAIGAGLMLVGVILAALLIRRRDVAMVQASESVHAGV
ncbi:MAG TPA: hypothetical protein PKD59_17210, partial [Miltoncostaeaceae bacterium]|nr:hypothetical protein [Miltoncostaeaceae bacterium]